MKIKLSPDLMVIFKMENLRLEKGFKDHLILARIISVISLMVSSTKFGSQFFYDQYKKCIFLIVNVP